MRILTAFCLVGALFTTAVHAQVLPPQNELEEAEEFFREHAPQRLERLQRLKDEDLEEFNEALHELVEHHRWLMELKEDEPEEYARRVKEIETENALLAMADTYRKTDDPDKKKEIRAEMAKRAQGLLDQHKRGLRDEIGNLKEEIARLERRLELMKNNPEVFIERKVAEMLDEEDPLAF
jgi:hypothetical protein